MIKAIGVIPARLKSTRLYEKVLQPLDGRPMIQHVWERVNQSRKLSEVVVACDDPKVVECVQAFGGTAIMTRRDHPNGSSRIAEVATQKAGDVFINIQGDEPMIHPNGIDQIICFFEKEPLVDVATLSVRRCDKEGYEDRNVVKVVCDQLGHALYFSRSPIPFFREGKPDSFSYLKHLGIYGYRKDFLLSFVEWETGTLEDSEKLEQLRILERGHRIRVLETAHDSWSVDTPEDLAAVELKIKDFSKKSEVS